MRIVGRVGLLAGGQQGQRDQAGGAGLRIVLDVGPGAVVALLRLFRIPDPVADRPLDLLAGHAGGARRLRRASRATIKRTMTQNEPPRLGELGALTGLPRSMPATER